MTYADGTTVAVENSRAGIERILRRYGCDSFVVGWEGRHSVLRFRAANRLIRFEIVAPSWEDPRFYRNGRNQTLTVLQRKGRADAEERRLWRCLALAIKAKLEVVESGIASFEEEFLAHIELPDGSKVGEWVGPQLAHVYETGLMPRLLPALEAGDPVVVGGGKSS
jgi:hypothetical protein